MEEKNNNYNMTPTKRLTYSAVLAALAAVFIIVTNFVPLRFSLLMAAAVCFYLAFYKCGIVYGFLTIIASILISFFVSPFSSAFFLSVIAFAPYSVMAFFLSRFSYTNIKGILVRSLCSVAFSLVAFMGVYLSAKFIDFDLLEIVQRYSFIGIYIAFILFIVVFDVFFSLFIKRVVALIK